MYSSVKEVFEKGLFARFQSEAAKGEHCQFLFQVSGTDYLVSVDDGALTIKGSSGEVPGALTLTLSEADFLDLVNGKEGIQLLFMTGRLRIHGDLPTAMKLVRFFPKEA